MQFNPGTFTADIQLLPPYLNDLVFQEADWFVEPDDILDLDIEVERDEDEY
jgi:hypothetical protein